MRMIFAISTMLIFLSAMPGCSSGKNPVELINGFTPNTNGEIQVASGQTGDSGTAPLAVFKGIIDPQALTVKLTPSRNAAKIGDIVDADITQFLMFQPCWNCVRVAHVSSGTIGLTIGFAIRHPVSNINVRPDLHAFDVHGIMILPSDTTFALQYPQPNGAGMGTVSGNVHLVANADGYTTHFDELAIDTKYFNPPLDIPGTLNPYKRYFTNFDTPTFNPHNPVGYNVFPVGSAWETQDFYLNTVQYGGPIEFVFVVDGSYGQSAVLKNRQNPQYYLPAFNRKEPWKVEPAVIENNLIAGNTSPTLTAKVRIDAYDWQGARTADPAYPDPSHLTGIPITSNVTGAYLSVPSLFDGVLQSTTPTGGSGAVGDPYRYEIEFTNEKGATVGDFIGLVSVRDELWDQQGPPGIPASPAGFPFQGLDIRDYSSYQTFTITIADPWDLHPDPFPGTYHVYWGMCTATGDFNNDGHADLAVGAYGAEPYGSVFAYFGNGESFNEPPVQMYSETSGYDEIGMRVAVGDITGDDVDDIVTVGLNGAIAVFPSDGAGGFGIPILYKDPVTMSSYFGTQLSVGRMNNDNYDDIVVSDYGATVTAINRAGKIYVHLFDGTSIQPAIEIIQASPAASACFGMSLGLTNLNNDDYDDILASYDVQINPNEYGDVEIITNDGTGHVWFREYLRTKMPGLNSLDFGSSITTVDFTGDGVQEWIIGAEMNDIGSADAAGEFFIIYPDGVNGFRGYLRIPNGNPEAYDRLSQQEISTGDINGDGALDLIVPAAGAYNGGKVELYLARGGWFEYYKTLTEPSFTPYPDTFGASVLGMKVDSDSADEVIVGSIADNWQGRLYVYFNP